MGSRYLPSTSIVIPVLDGAGTLDECLQSVLALDYPGQLREILVVDNGSTDGTKAILERYGDEIRVIEEPKRGPAAARNRGIAAARNEVIAFTDADCRVDPRWLREIVRPLEANEVGAVGGRILAKDPEDRIQAYGDTIHDHEKAICVYRPHYVISMSWASRRTVLKEHPFDVGFIGCEDLDLSYRLQKAGYTLAYAPEAIVHHSNAGSLAALLRKGCQHGYWSVRLAREHHEFLGSRGHPRIHRIAYSRIAAGLRGAFKGPDRPEALCEVAFQVGKKLGKGFGSLRFGYLYL